MKDKFAEEYKTIGLNIAYYRKLRGLTQLHIEAPNVPTSVSLEVILQIAYVLNVPAGKLLDSPLRESQ